MSAAIGFGAAGSEDYCLDLPFRRSRAAILVSAVFLIAFSIPLWTMGEMFGGGGDDSLFSLVSFLFTLFWMLGWSSGVLVLLLIFLCLSIGREYLHVNAGKLSVQIGFPGLALSASYDQELIRNFEFQDGSVADAKQWRGSHIAFDYGDRSVAFGSNIDGPEAKRIISRLNNLFPLHDAAPIEVSALQTTASAAHTENGEPVQVSDTDESARPVRWNSLSGIMLILANLIPLFGVWIAGWEIGQIMLLFWTESAIIGYYNLCKMWLIGRWSLLFYGPFFIGHYGAFMAVHLLFIYALFGGEIAGGADATRTQVLSDLLALWPAMLGLLISHGTSFYINFVRKKKSQGRNMAMQMQEPYRRVIIMHLTLILGGFLALSMGTNVAALMSLLLLKIVADLRGHITQHSS
ncbi:MAG: hypothetical protein DHS20C12_21840 [Pseudohongiella sp.]|nr:MAG: hypothetical protein DHS20C12_21840 [Pseudohongiella sp.]